MRKDTNVKANPYYKLQEAEEIIQTFSSWVGKKAHAGNGALETLKGITLKKKRSHSTSTNNELSYRVIFEFENNKKFSAGEFLKINSLASHTD
ncbi:MAG: hypothetical protein ACJ76F_00580 [Bacteroidia bacterium]